MAGRPAHTDPPPLLGLSLAPISSQLPPNVISGPLGRRAWALSWGSGRLTKWAEVQVPKLGPWWPPAPRTTRAEKQGWVRWDPGVHRSQSLLRGTGRGPALLMSTHRPAASIRAGARPLHGLCSPDGPWGAVCPAGAALGSPQAPGQALGVLGPHPCHACTHLPTPEMLLRVGVLEDSQRGGPSPYTWSRTPRTHTP